MRWLNCLYFPLCLLILAGCSSGPDSVPSGVLSHDKMQQVLWDIIEADQYSMTYLRKDSTRIDVKAQTAGLYEQVFQLHKTSRDQFNKSIRYYFSRPDIAKPLFDSLAAMGVRKRMEDYNHGAGTHTPTVPVSVPNTVPPNKILPKSVQPKNIAPNHAPAGNVPGQLPSGKMPNHNPPKKVRGPANDSILKQKL